MSYKLVDKAIDSIDHCLFALADWFGTVPSKYIDLATADSFFTLTTHNGSLMSGIRLRGYNSLCGDVEFQAKIINWYTFWKNRLAEGSGHELHWFHEIDPDAAVDILNDNLRPARRQARRMGLQVDDLIDEKNTG